MSVESPRPASASLMLVRVLPATRTMASAMPLAAKAVVNTPSFSAPSQPLAVTGTPRAASTAATPMPLPPASVCCASARCTAPGTRVGMRTVWSMAGLSVMVNTRAGAAAPARTSGVMARPFPAWHMPHQKRPQHNQN